MNTFIRSLNNAPFCDYTPNQTCAPYWTDELGRLRSYHITTPSESMVSFTYHNEVQENVKV